MRLTTPMQLYRTRVLPTAQSYDRCGYPEASQSYPCTSTHTVHMVHTALELQAGPDCCWQDAEHALLEGCCACRVGCAIIASDVVSKQHVLVGHLPCTCINAALHDALSIRAEAMASLLHAGGTVSIDVLLEGCCTGGVGCAISISDVVLQQLVLVGGPFLWRPEGACH